MGFSRQEDWSGLPCPPPGLPDSGMEPLSLLSPALAGAFFTTSTTWEWRNFTIKKKKNLPVSDRSGRVEVPSCLEGFLNDKVLKIESALWKTVIAGTTETFKTLF